MLRTHTHTKCRHIYSRTPRTPHTTCRHIYARVHHTPHTKCRHVCAHTSHHTHSQAQNEQMISPLYILNFELQKLAFDIRTRELVVTTLAVRPWLMSFSYYVPTWERWEMRTTFLSGIPTKIGYLKDLVANGKTIGIETINKVLLVNFSSAL